MDNEESHKLLRVSAHLRFAGEVWVDNEESHKLLRVSAHLRFAGRCGWTMRKATNSYAFPPI